MHYLTEAEGAKKRIVVVSGENDKTFLPHERHSLGGKRAVSDYVAEADDLLRAIGARIRDGETPQSREAPHLPLRRRSSQTCGASSRAEAATLAVNLGLITG